MFTITFWGVRGTVPTPGADHGVYGGNTSCVEVNCGERRLIFDAGTGIRALGNELKIADVDILLSHTHIDHIQGFPFFLPIYQAQSQVRVWAGHLWPEYRIHDVMASVMQPPVFPLVLNDLPATMEWYDFTAGERLAPAYFMKHGIFIRTMPLAHPDRATAYRIEYQGHSVCYVTDVEHREGVVDQELADFVQGTDLLIYDSTFDDQEFDRFRGWGHSTWQQAIRIAKEADVGQVALFHHDPAMNDEGLAVRDANAKRAFKGAFCAREGMVVELL